MSGVKRKRVVLSLLEKQQVLQGLDNGEKPSDLCEKFGISRQQVSDIKKNRARISKYCDSVDNSNGLKRKVLKMSTAPEVDESLFEWFQAQKMAGEIISNEALQEKAVSIFIQLCPNESPEAFKASKGWLRNFKRRHGLLIKTEENAGDASSNDKTGTENKNVPAEAQQQSPIEDQIDKLNEKIDQLNEKQQNLADTLASLTGTSRLDDTELANKVKLESLEGKVESIQGITDVAFL